MIIKELKEEISNLYTITNNHILYTEITKLLTINSLSKEAQQEFKEFSSDKMVLPGLYNLSRFFGENENVDVLKKAIKNRKHNFYVPDEKYYAICIDDGNIWKEHINSLYKFNKIKDYLKQGIYKEKDLVALSKLKDYEINYPNRVLWDSSLFNSEIDKKTKSYLMENKLMYIPSEKENFLK